MTLYPRKTFTELLSRLVERAIRKVTGKKPLPHPDQAKRFVLDEEEMACLVSPKYRKYEMVTPGHRIEIAAHRCEDNLPYVYLPQYEERGSWHYYTAQTYVLAFGTRQAVLDVYKEAGIERQV